MSQTKTTKEKEHVYVVFGGANAEPYLFAIYKTMQEAACAVAEIYIEGSLGTQPKYGGNEFEIKRVPISTHKTAVEPMKLKED